MSQRQSWVGRRARSSPTADATSSIWRSAVDATGDAYSVMKAIRVEGAIVDWQVVDMNSVARRRWHVADEPAQSGWRLSLTGPGPHVETIMGLYAAALTKGRRQGSDIEIPYPGRAHEWRQVTAAPLGNDMVVQVSRDITTRRDAEDTARYERNRFEAIMAQACDVLLLVDEAAVVTWVSESVERILGVDAAVTLGRSLAELAHPDDADALLRLTNDLADGAEGVPLRARLRHADGAHRWFEVSSRNRASDPMLGGVLLSLHDVTEQQLAAGGAAVVGGAHPQSPGDGARRDHLARCGRLGHLVQPRRRAHLRLAAGGGDRSPVYRFPFDYRRGRLVGLRGNSASRGRSSRRSGGAATAGCSRSRARSRRSKSMVSVASPSSCATSPSKRRSRPASS